MEPGPLTEPVRAGDEGRAALPGHPRNRSTITLMILALMALAGCATSEVQRIARQNGEHVYNLWVSHVVQAKRAPALSQ
jgi:uncharacterized OsmC-like protein